MLKDIEHRVVILEASNRRLQISVAGLVFAAILWICLGSTQPERMPDVLRVRRLEIVNASGTAVITLESLVEKGVITISDEKGAPAVLMAAGGEGSGVATFNDRNGNLLVKVAANEVGLGSITTFDPDGHAMVYLGGVDGGGYAAIYNKAGHELVTLSSALGDGVVAVYGALGTLRDVLYGGEGDASKPETGGMEEQPAGGASDGTPDDR